jgi:glycerol-3-phosphate dehydrogenase
LEDDEHLRSYGSEAAAIRELMHEDHSLRELLHPRLPYQRAEVIWHVRQEMARTVEDVLARRTRALLLDARASMEAADEVARLVGKELGWDAPRCVAEAERYRELARGYLLA